MDLPKTRLDKSDQFQGRQLRAQMLSHNHVLDNSDFAVSQNMQA